MTEYLIIVIVCDENKGVLQICKAPFSYTFLRNVVSAMKLVGNRHKKIKIPGIGLRIIKSAVAVGLCYVVDLLRGDQGIVFYSQLAALWCIQVYRSNTKKNAIQRTIGTIVGAVYGLIFLLLDPVLIEVGVKASMVDKLLVPLMIVLVLYTTVLLRKKQASYFSCVVFLSIAVNHLQDANPYIFVLNRFLDTMIGIGIGFLVNDINLCFHPKKDVLFISGLDGMLLNDKEMLSAFSKIELNRMIDSGMNFTVSTMRTPASIIEPMHDVHLELPVIAMNGAVLYDTNKHSYIKAYVISKQTSNEVMELINEADICSYANVIIDDMLVIYYQDVEDEINRNLVEKLRTSPFRNYVKRPLPDDEAVTYFMLLDKKEKISAFYKKLEEEGYLDKLRVITYDSNDFKGYAYIKIYNKNATKENMINYLMEYTNLEKVVTFGSIENQYDVYIDTDDANKVVKEVRKRYEPIFR